MITASSTIELMQVPELICWTGKSVSYCWYLSQQLYHSWYLFQVHNYQLDCTTSKYPLLFLIVKRRTPAASEYVAWLRLNSSQYSKEAHGFTVKDCIMWAHHLRSLYDTNVRDWAHHFKDFQFRLHLPWNSLLQDNICHHLANAGYLSVQRCIQDSIVVQ